MKKNTDQRTFDLTQDITVARAHSLCCIPDRFAAENELTHLQAEYGPRLLKFAIRKDRKGKDSTYTLRYFTRETETINLF
jgi:hypothetical protein